MRGLKTDWRSRVYMPTVMDSAVLSLRKWLDGSAGPIPWPQVSAAAMGFCQYPAARVPQVEPPAPASRAC